MSTYTEFTFELQPFEPWNEILVAQLSELDFESFVEEEPFLKAYIQTDLLDENQVNKLVLDLKTENNHISFTFQEIKQQNWNAVWESQFEPVYVGEKLLIKAPFHNIEDFNGLVIEIEPKMSFGTGHHQTTHLMCEQILSMDLKDCSILDMGAGTGVLSILAEKLGSNYIEAVEIEEWSAENCAENATRNLCTKITSLFGDYDVVSNQLFDVILANINKNVLKSHLPFYSSKIEKDGILLLSGFFTTDNEELIAAANKVGFEFVVNHQKENWSLLKFIKK